MSPGESSVGVTSVITIFAFAAALDGATNAAVTKIRVAIKSMICLMVSINLPICITFSILGCPNYTYDIPVRHINNIP